MIFTRWCFAVTGKIFLVKMGKYASAKLYSLLYNIQRIKRWVWSEHSKAAATWPESDVLANSYMYVWAWWPISSTLFSGSRTTKWLDVCSLHQLVRQYSLNIRVKEELCEESAFSRIQHKSRTFDTDCYYGTLLPTRLELLLLQTLSEKYYSMTLQ